MNYKQNNKDALLKAYGKEPSTLDELAEAVIASLKTDLNVLGFAWRINYSNKVSNSHSSPINGVSNFTREAGVPLGYPGFSGRVWLRTDNKPRSGISDNFARTCTRPGTGGQGGYSGPWEYISQFSYRRSSSYVPSYKVQCYGWDYRFFIEDFPLVAELVEQIQTISNLKNEPFSIEHRFEWTDPETAKADELYVNSQPVRV